MPSHWLHTSFCTLQFSSPAWSIAPCSSSSESSCCAGVALLLIWAAGGQGGRGERRGYRRRAAARETRAPRSGLPPRKRQLQSGGYPGPHRARRLPGAGPAPGRRAKAAAGDPCCRVLGPTAGWGLQAGAAAAAVFSLVCDLLRAVLYVHRALRAPDAAGEPAQQPARRPWQCWGRARAACRVSDLLAPQPVPAAVKYEPWQPTCSSDCARNAGQQQECCSTQARPTRWLAQTIARATFARTPGMHAQQAKALGSAPPFPFLSSPPNA